MTAAVSYDFHTGHVGPWTEEEYLHLGETPDRIELFDGSLVLPPSPTPIHQHVSRRLAGAFDPSSEAAGLRVYLAVNLRLKPNRIVIPDLVVVAQIDPTKLLVEPASVMLACEVTSPSNAATDRVLKLHYYAEAGIPWYLLVDTDPEPTLQLFRREGDNYILDSVGKPGEALSFPEPFSVGIDPATLLL